MRLFRLLKILLIASRYGLDQMILDHEPSSGKARALMRTLAVLPSPRTAWLPPENSPSLAHTCRPPRSTTWSCA